MFDTLSEKFSDAFKNLKGKGKITEDNIELTLKEVRTALLAADVNFVVVKEFIKSVKEKALGEKVLRGVDPHEQFIKIVHDELASVMGEEHKELSFERKDVLPILVVGLNGQGKTTFSGKLSLYLKNKKKKKVLLIPADTFRPAAKDQLITLAKSMSVDYFDSNLALGPTKLVDEGLKFAKDNDYDVAIIDTAGRLHVDDELMGELTELKKSLEKRNPEVLMVADAMTGQEAVNVAKTFHEKIALTGVVLSKMDSDARGGAALSIRHVTGVPIVYISTGERMKDLENFHPDRLAKRILDMGDVLSLVEKAEEAIDEKEAEKMMKKMQKGKFTVTDFLKQMEMISKMGPMGNLLKMIPGMGGALREVGDLSSAEGELKKMKVIISSMTNAERDDYTLMKESRRKRVAAGSGTKVSDVDQFLAKFKQMEGMMGQMMGMMGGGMPGMPALPGMGQEQKGFRQAPGGKMKKNKKGKKKGPWGGGFFK
jgi:signal recognition particle subunit SRP54